jgi:hypothetical protein
MRESGVPRASLVAIASSAVAVLAACGGATDKIALVFPDQVSRKSTSVVAVTAFEPFMYPPEMNADPILVECGDFGVFPPTRKPFTIGDQVVTIDPDQISTTAGLGRLLTDMRVSDSFPLEGGEWSVGLQKLAQSAKNPWGAVMVYIEARGEVRAPQAQGGGQVSATLLAGCYCVSTLDGNYGANPQLDQQVRNACPQLSLNSGSSREVQLKSVLDPVFHLEACSVQQLTAPKSQALSPGPAVCITTTRCDDPAAGGGGGTGPSGACFKCQQPCSELTDEKNVPILFTVDQAGGSSMPKQQIVLTDMGTPDNNMIGTARGEVTVDDCASPITVHAQVVGRPDTNVDFSVSCVSPVTGFACKDETLLPVMKEPADMTTIPGVHGEKDVIAVLYDSGQHASVEVRDQTGVLSTVDYPGETARAVKGYAYDLAMRPQDQGRAVLAVVTSKTIQALAKEQIQVYLYEWASGQLRTHDGSPMPGKPFNQDCTRWNCPCQIAKSYIESTTGMSGCMTPGPPLCTSLGDVVMPGDPMCGMPLEMCSATSPATCSCPGSTFDPCSCHLAVEFQTEVTVETADLDYDGKADLAIGTSSDLPINIWYSSETSTVGLYKDDCSCGRFAQAPTTFELLDFGTPPPDKPGHPLVDLVIGAPGGAFVRYATLEGDGRGKIECEQPERFGGLVPVRDLARGFFQCNPQVPGNTCEGLQDLVMVAARSLGGGSFEDPGTIRVIYGSDADLSKDDRLFERAGATIELIARALPMHEDPRDPRSARVGDFNNDGNDDLAVLFGSTEEVHIWLGSGNKGLGEVNNGINLDSCETAPAPTAKCSPLRQFALADLDGTGTKQVLVICDPTAMARLRRYAPMVSK